MLDEAGLNPVRMSEHHEEALLEEVEDAVAILVRTAEIPESVIRKGKNLKVIGRHGVGVDNIDMETATELGIVVVNAPESNVESVAEHTIGFMIAAGKKMLKADQAQREGRYEVRNEYIGTELKEKTLGTVGIGRIGSEVVKKAQAAFDMDVQAYDPYLTQDDMPEGVELVEDLNELLATSDFVSIHCPLTEGTRGLIGAEELSQMNSSAFLINVARGGIVKEDALIEALKEGTIEGAATDVFEEEPPSKDNPLFDILDIVVTPHMASHTHTSMLKMATHPAEGIIDVLEGRKPKFPVNPEVLE